jgi:hypothetical protein
VRVRTRLHLAALAVLLTGLVAGTIIYAMAEEPGESAGFEDTNAYRHQLQRLGGKALVLYDRFERWFESLWQGKALGVTILWLGGLGALGLWLLGRLLDEPPGD